MAALARMSDGVDDDPDPVPALECEECRALYRPEQFGFASVDDVPLHVVCTRCGAPLAVVIDLGE